MYFIINNIICVSFLLTYKLFNTIHFCRHNIVKQSKSGVIILLHDGVDYVYTKPYIASTCNIIKQFVFLNNLQYYHIIYYYILYK